MRRGNIWKAMIAAFSSLFLLSSVHGMDLEEGEKALRAGEFLKAVDLFGRSLALGEIDREGCGRAYFGLGEAYMKLNQPDLAMEMYERASSISPDNVLVAKARLEIGRISFDRMDQGKRAAYGGPPIYIGGTWISVPIETQQEGAWLMVKLYPRIFAMKFLHIHQIYPDWQRERTMEAIKSFQNAISMLPEGGEEAKLALGSLLSLMPRWEQGMKILEELARSQGPISARAILLMGDRYAGRERWADAVASYRTALERDLPDDLRFMALERLTKAYFKQGLEGLASKTVDEIASKFPMSTRAAYARLLLGDLYKEKGEEGKAKEEWSKAFEIYKAISEKESGEKRAEAIFGMGRCHIDLYAEEGFSPWIRVDRMTIYPEALKAYQRVVDEHSKSIWAPRALLSMGEIAIGVDPDRAIPYYARLLSDYPDSDEAYWAIIKLAELARPGEPRRRQEEARKALEGAGRSTRWGPHLSLRLGQIYLILGDEDKFRETMAKGALGYPYNALTCLLLLGAVGPISPPSSPEIWVDSARAIDGLLPKVEDPQLRWAFLLEKARILERAKRVEDAKGILLEIPERFIGWNTVVREVGFIDLFIKGRAQFEEGDYEGAIDSLSGIHPSSPLWKTSFMMIGEASERVGRPWNTAVVLTNIADVGSMIEEAEARLQLARVFAGLGRSWQSTSVLALAEKKLLDALTRSSSEGAATIGVSVTGAERGRLEELLKRVRWELEALKRVEAAGMIEDPKGAISIYREVIEKYKGSIAEPVASLSLADLYQKLGDYKMAISILEGMSTPDGMMRGWKALKLARAMSAVGEGGKAKEIISDAMARRDTPEELRNMMDEELKKIGGG
jgi:tetratricopeptide (TPR) repeat protein